MGNEGHPMSDDAPHYMSDRALIDALRESHLSASPLIVEAASRMEALLDMIHTYRTIQARVERSRSGGARP